MFSEEDRQRNVRSFQKRARLLLTDSERDYLHDVLKQYQSYKDVGRFMACLKETLDTPVKLDLLREIRGLVPPGHLRQFDDMAPYKKMAHPFQPPSVGGETWRGMPNWYGQGGRSSFGDWVQSPNGMLSPIECSRIINVDVEGDDIGFIIKGGAEQKMGIFVSRVEPDSLAEMSGLLAGDQLLEVNNISFEVIPIHTASTVLRSSTSLKMKVLTPPKAKQPRKTNQWFESKSPPSANIDKERTVLIQLDDHYQCIGFNIRGGSEYGLGVFVSRIDSGGLADLNGIKPGDEILEVNGRKLDNITHKECVDLIRNQRNMIMRIRSTNKVPTYPRIEDNVPRTRSQSTGLKSGSTSPPSSYDGSVKSEMIPNKDWLVRTEPANKNLNDEQQRPSSSASSHSSKQGSGKSVPSSTRPKADRPVAKERTDRVEEPRTSTPNKKTGPRAREKKGRLLGRSFSVKVTGEKKRPMLHSDNVYQKSDKKGKSLKQMLFGSKSGHAHKAPEEKLGAVEEDPIASTRQDDVLNESMTDKRGRKGRGRMPKLLNSFRRSREEVKIKRRVPLERQDPTPDQPTEEVDSPPNWATRKKALHVPDDTNKTESYGSIGKQRGLFVQGAGTQVMLGSVTAPSKYAMFEDAAKTALSSDESKAALRHIKRYEETGSVDSLVVPLLAILDEPEKLLMLREIRGFIQPKDIGRFDALVSKRELEAMQQVNRYEDQGSTTNGHQALYQPSSAEGSMTHSAPYSPLVSPNPIPVGPSEYVNIQTNDNGNLARMKNKKVMISSNPEIIPRVGSYEEGSSQEATPREGTNGHFTFSLSEADALASLNSVLRDDSPRDVNDNPVSNRQTAEPVGQGDFRGGFTASSTRQQNQLQTFTPAPQSQVSIDTSEDSDSSYGAQRSGSYGFGSSNADPVRNAAVLSTNRPAKPPPPPPASSTPPPSTAPQPIYANVASRNPPAKNGSTFTPTGDPREALYAKVDKSRRNGERGKLMNNSRNTEPPYASLSEFDGLSITSAESDWSASITPKKGILKASINTPGWQSSPGDFTDDYEPSPLREIGDAVRREGTLDLNIAWPPSAPIGDSFRVELSKANQTLGLSVSGGSDCKHQPYVKIDEIIPGGAAAKEGSLQVSYVIVGIDGRSLRNVTHNEAVDIIRHSYDDKRSPYMSVEFLPAT